jgi:hypothetical protein
MKHGKRSYNARIFTIGKLRIQEIRRSADGRLRETASIGRDAIPSQCLPSSAARYSESDSETEYFVGKQVLTVEFRDTRPTRRTIGKFCRDHNISLGARADYLQGSGIIAYVVRGAKADLESLILHPLVFRHYLSSSTPSASNALHRRYAAMRALQNSRKGKRRKGKARCFHTCQGDLNQLNEIRRLLKD